MGGELASNSETRRPSRTCQVEPGGTGGKIQSLLGETSWMRVREESAEAIVARKPGESWEERRAEGHRYKSLRRTQVDGEREP